MFHLSCRQAGKEGLWECRHLQEDVAERGNHHAINIRNSSCKNGYKGPAIFRKLPPVLSPTLRTESHLRQLTLNEYPILLPVHLNYESAGPHSTKSYQGL